MPYDFHATRVLIIVMNSWKRQTRKNLILKEDSMSM